MVYTGTLCCLQGTKTIGCIRSVEDAGDQSLLITVVNPNNGRTQEVTLIVPVNLLRGEYMLWADESTIELGKAGSIMQAMNKVRLVTLVILMRSDCH